MNHFYREYFIEYDEDTLMVYVSGLTEDDYWEEVLSQESNDPEEFAYGYHEALKQDGHFSTVSKVSTLGD